MKSFKKIEKFLLVGIIILGLGACTEPNYREDKKIVIKPKEREIQKEEKTMFSLNLDTNFDFDKADVKEETLEKIVIFSKKLEGIKGELSIIGHTDTVGSEKYNVELSKKRAEAIWVVLKEYINEEAYTVKVEGRGEEEPLVEEATKEDRAKNRRVEIKFKEK